MTAIPRPNTTGVSTLTTIIVGASREPTGLTLLANGVPVGPLSFQSIGGGTDGARTTFWKLAFGSPPTNRLEPSTVYVLSAGDADGGAAATEVTRFTTGPGYDKQPGTPPVVRALNLWRVRYPVKDIASGNCVFAEYHGFLSVDYEPATIPNTPTDAVVHTFALTLKTGGPAQGFVYAGATPFRGAAPDGDYPLPISDWQPELDPTREYCLTISAFGDGDLARLGVTSNTLCGPVAQRSTTGAPPPPSIGGGGAAAPGGGGCSVAGGRNGPAGALLALTLLGWRRARRRPRAPTLR